ncbi:MAG: PASTA domain-containing protein, partial [Bacteroidota bacterium]
LHLVLAVIAGLMLIWLTLVILGWYTHHGEAYEVPDLTGLKTDETGQLDLERDYELVVVDSVFDEHFTKGAIVLQDPPPGSKVKRGRKIYVTTVAIQPEMVRMPDLVDLSLRQALFELKEKGLKLEKLTFVRNFARNAVLAQHFEGDTISPGTELLKGSDIELILGKGLTNEKAQVPFLIGLSESEAIERINNSSLNVGYLKYLDGRDKLHSRVYRQQPPAGSGHHVEYGAPVDIWLRSDEYFDFDSLLLTFDVKVPAIDSLHVN